MHFDEMKESDFSKPIACNSGRQQCFESISRVYHQFAIICCHRMTPESSHGYWVKWSNTASKKVIKKESMACY
jgi:hypothetical protein